MKDQYFGDVNDYRKYGLLRALSAGSQLGLGVCWLRTANDSGRDGEFRKYLHRPESWRYYDPELYDALRRLLEPAATRSVLNAESWDLLPGAVYALIRAADLVMGRWDGQISRYVHAIV